MIDTERIIARDMTNHRPTEATQEKMENVRAAYHSVVDTLEDYCKDSRETSLAITNLEQSLMWAMASLARRDYDNAYVPQEE